MKNTNKILAAVMLIMLVISFAGCSSENGYEKVVDKYCSAVQKNDFNAIKSIIDWDNVGKMSEFNGRNYDKKEAEETFKEMLTAEYEKLEYKYDKGFTVEHGQIMVLKDNSRYENYALKRLQKLVKLENEAEDADAAKFVNDFVAGLKYVTVVKTNITVKSKKDSSQKERKEETFVTYCYKGKWYRDIAVLDYVVNILDARERVAGTDDSGDDGWG